MNVKIVFFLMLIFEGSRQGPRTCFLRLDGVQGGPWESRSDPRGAFLEGPGSAKVRQGSTFEGKTGRILTFSFFASNDYLKSRGGSRKRGGRPKRGPGEGSENLIRSLGALFGRSGAANGRQGASRGGRASPDERPSGSGGALFNRNPNIRPESESWRADA